ncbi:hypothetical protein ACOZ4L_12050 [Haloplanus ruber]|uniref:Uncharacterized protein n=1 Tax=Haloplanus ruber TaxID=869892 RepID=A0ABD6CXB7_9EURY|nr:hypothetical protein [Haloplanus ruber]
MSTHQQSTTDTRTEPTLTDGRWTAETNGTTGETPVDPAHMTQHQFTADARYRLPNLVDDENRAMF